MATQIAEQAAKAAEKLQQQQKQLHPRDDDQNLLTLLSVPDSIPEILQELTVLTATQQYMEHVQVLI